MMVQFFINHLKKIDWILIICGLVLTAVGLLSIYSSSIAQHDFLNFKKQLIFLGIGFLLMVAISFFDWKALKENPYLILFLYIFCVLGLTGLFFLAPEIKGVKSWYKLGPISIDPIELFKIVFIILLAKFFSMRHIEMYRIRHILLSALYLFVPGALIFFQPDLGSVLILVVLWFFILVISGIKLRHFLILTLISLLILALSWFFLLEDYQKQRIISFIAPHLEPLGAGWSQQQSKVAIGSGGVLGKGIGKGPQTQYGFLPEPQTDFIFAAIAEEVGLVGVSLLLVLFSILLWRVIKVGALSSSNFSRLFCCGFGILLFSQIFINIGMNLGLLPIIGIPLPLVSYGGSSLIMTFTGLGIVQSIKTRL